MDNSARDIARRLAREAEAVCRHYLSNGRKQGQYWTVGDVDNTPGRSLYVRLTGPDSGPGAAGKWSDAATGEHGDLLDLIAANLRIATLADTLDEARRFLSLPRPEASTPARSAVHRGSPKAARRLWAMGQPIGGTLAVRYLASRGLSGLGDLPCLRFHPSCFYWREDHPATEPPERWPALLAKVTDANGRFSGLHRTWLDPETAGKAPVDPPRKAMGHLLGNGVRIGEATTVLVAGEGLETMLSLHRALPGLPVVAALSANHLSALQLPETLQRLYIAADADAPGRAAADDLGTRARSAGIEIRCLTPRLWDFNDDLCAYGLDDLRAQLQPQLASDDALAFFDAGQA